jgi:hypothetical protein
MTGIKEKLIDVLSVALALFFPFSLLLLVFSVEIFVNNHSELYNEIGPLRPLLNAAAIVGGICLAAGVLLSCASSRVMWN